MESILVIDDDEVSVFLTKHVLGSMGIGSTIQTACNGAEGLKLIKAAAGQGQLPQLILLDIKMPVMDGFALLEELGKLRDIDLSATKIVLLSSSHNPWEMEKAKKYMATAFLHKPLTKNELQSILG